MDVCVICKTTRLVSLSEEERNHHVNRCLDNDVEESKGMGASPNPVSGFPCDDDVPDTTECDLSHSTEFVVHEVESGSESFHSPHEAGGQDRFPSERAEELLRDGEDWFDVIRDDWKCFGIEGEQNGGGDGEVQVGKEPSPSIKDMPDTNSDMETTVPSWVSEENLSILRKILKQVGSVSSITEAVGELFLPHTNVGKFFLITDFLLLLYSSCKARIVCIYTYLTFINSQTERMKTLLKLMFEYKDFIDKHTIPNGKGLEVFTSFLFRAIGCDSEVSGGKGDGGVDVRVWARDQMFLVQCKQ
jgi:hypothetical protein